MNCEKPLIRIHENTVLYDELKTTFISYKHFPYKKSLSRYKVNGWIDVYPCGQCIHCLNMKRYHWVKKMELERNNWLFNYFITITYNDDNLPSELQVKDLQNFIKYYRKFDNNFKYFACGEYGSRTMRPHYHLILFTNMSLDLKHLKNTPNGVLFTSQLLEKCWLNKGFIFVAHDFNSASFSYVCSYSNKTFAKFSLNSKIRELKKQLHENIIFWYNNYVPKGLQLPPFNGAILRLTNAYISEIKRIRNLKPEFIVMSKCPPIGSGTKFINLAPSTLLKWMVKHNIDKDAEQELIKRKKEYDVFLNNHDINDMVISNTALSKNKILKKKGIF